MITVDLRSRVPIYEQIKTQIMQLILIGVLMPHDQITSVRQLAKNLAINFNTVKKAFGELESEGVIYTLVGRGSFVAENALGNTQLRQKAAQNVKTALTSARATGLTREEIINIIGEVYGTE